ncbi:hypothetical protein CLOP_g2390 [Closterium sp. NIES-67]|nr:hypothetical protein CLOP_g2390 [Closterium sp. NIES-67]
MEEPASGSHGIFQNRSAVRILADKNGGQFRSQNCIPNLVRVVRVSGNAVRTHQCTSDVPSKMRGGIHGRHSHLLVRHEAARRTPATRFSNSSTRTILHQIVQERLRTREGPIPRTYREHSRRHT